MCILLFRVLRGPARVMGGGFQCAEAVGLCVEGARESEKERARLFASFLFPTLRWRERARRRTVEGVAVVCVKTDVLLG